MKTNNKQLNKIMLPVDLVILSSGIALDQWTKVLATRFLKAQPAIPIIKDILELDYVENRGAAFGMLQGKRIYFLLIAATVFFLFAWLLLKLPPEKKYQKLHIALSFILAGAVGNTLDRGLKGYVVDFVYFKLINFPVFNVADIFITVTTIWLAVLLLFFFKEEDFDFLRSRKNRKNREKDTENK